MTVRLDVLDLDFIIIAARSLKKSKYCKVDKNKTNQSMNCNVMHCQANSFDWQQGHYII